MGETYKRDKHQVREPTMTSHFTFKSTRAKVCPVTSGFAAIQKGQGSWAIEQWNLHTIRHEERDMKWWPERAASLQFSDIMTWRAVEDSVRLLLHMISDWRCIFIFKYCQNKIQCDQQMFKIFSEDTHLCKASSSTSCNGCHSNIFSTISYDKVVSDQFFDSFLQVRDDLQKRYARILRTCWRATDSARSASYASISTCETSRGQLYEGICLLQSCTTMILDK